MYRIENLKSSAESTTILQYQILHYSILFQLHCFEPKKQKSIVAMTEAAVGSIAHIIKTAFKSEFDNVQKIEESKVKLKEREEKLVQRAETKRLREEAQKASEASAKVKGKVASKVQEIIAPQDDDESDIEEVEVVTNPIDQLPLSEEYRLALEKKLKAIEIEKNSRYHGGDELVKYLRDQRKQAIEEEILEEETLKKQGIMVGQHIPSLASKLDLDANIMNSYGPMSSNLIISKDLMEQNHINKLRRTGNLPISEEAELKKTKRRQYTENVDDKTAHYLQTTGAQKNRVTVNTQKFQNSLTQHRTIRATTMGISLDDSPPKNLQLPKRHYGLSMAQKQVNENILESMNRKNNFLKNPRNDPYEVSNLLTKPKRSLSVKDGKPSSGAVTDHPEVGDDNDASSAGGRRSIQSVVSPRSAASLSTAEKKKMQAAIPKSPLFLAEPSTVFFKDYQKGNQYHASLVLRNVSAASRSVRVIPPATKNFCISPWKYPQHCTNGIVAPGMHISCQISFFPESLADFEDEIQVETEGGTYTVKIYGQRDAPKLSLPTTLLVGTCLVGDATSVSMKCVNVGGVGMFKVMDYDAYPPQTGDIANKNNGCLRIAPFTVYPTEFTLSKNSHVDLIIEYVPLTIGNHEHTIVFLSDNDQFVTMTLRGIGGVVTCDLSEINSVNVLQGNQLSLSKDLFFSSCCIGMESEQEISVANSTGIPLEYEWVWIETNAKDVRRSSLLQIASREKREEKFSSFGVSKGMDEIDAESSATLGQASHASKNAVSMNAFELSPARGVLPANGHAPFVVKFVPTSFAPVSGKVVLTLRGVTKPSMPGKKQQQYLDELSEKEHGKFHRLKSWIEEIGMEVKFNEPPLGIADNGGYIEPPPSNMLNLDTILSLATSHCASELDRESLFALKYVIAKVAFRANNFLLHVEEDEEQAGCEELGSVVELVVHSWDMAKDNSDPITLPDMVIEIPDEIPTSMENCRNVLNPDNSEVRTLLKSLWVDSNVATRIMGSDVASVLNEKVKHESVDYIQRCSRVHAPVLDLSVFGSGKTTVIDYFPLQLNVGGVLAIGKSWTGKIQVNNRSDITCEADIDVEALTVVNLDISSEKETMSPDLFQVSVSTMRMVLLSGSSEDIQVTVSASVIGTYELTIPVIPSNRFLTVPNLIVRIKTVGPKIRFENPEIDLGLITTGTENKVVLTFSNDTDIPLNYALVSNITDAVNTMMLGGPPTTSSNKRQSTGMSARDDDAASTSRSVATENSADSYAIENPTALVSFSPPAGSLQPGANASVIVTITGGKFPQRIRGTCDCTVFDINGVHQIGVQSVSIRGEVQSPKTIIHPLNVNLGEIYLNAPIQFSVVVQNLTNLASKFKFERPGGESSSFTMKYSDRSGTLGPLESKEITITFTPLISGGIDEIIGCKVFGTLTPLGFGFHGKVRGIQLEIVNLSDSDPIPIPLCKPTDTQYTGVGEVPTPAQIMPLDFGRKVVLYERVVRRFAIRNLSAIGFSFTVRPKKYDVGKVKKKNPIDGEEDDLSMTTERSKTEKKYALEPHESGEDIFHSEAGKKHITAVLKRQEDKAYLSLGLGASYSMQPKHGEVEPWGVVVISVMARNDMPGTYDDEIVCDVKDFRKFMVPVKLSIAGCPLSIERDSYGMTTMKSENSNDNSQPLLLHMGHASVNSEPLEREFRVRNNGSSLATVAWKVRSVSSKVNGPVKVEIRLGSLHGKTTANCKVLFWDDVAKDNPYVVDPPMSSIAPYSKRNFKVRLLKTTSINSEMATITGSISFVENENPLGISEDVNPNGDDCSHNSHLSASQSRVSLNSSTSRQSSVTSKGGYKLKLTVKGILIEPQIRINKYTIDASSFGVVEALPEQGVRIKTSAPALFSKEKLTSDICSKIVTLTNPTLAVLALGISVDGPFTIKSLADESAEQDEKMTKKKVSFKDATKLMSTSMPGNANTVSTLGGMCVLPSQVCHISETKVVILILIFVFVSGICTLCRHLHSSKISSQFS